MSVRNELARIQKELRVGKGRENKFGGFNYRNAEDILKAAKSVMGEGFSITLSDDVVVLCSGQPHMIVGEDKSGKKLVGGDRYYIKSTATISGQDNEHICATGWAREADFKKGMDPAQLSGSTSSYARKYAMAGLFALDDGKDADALATGGKTAAMPEYNSAPAAPDTIQFGKFKGKKISDIPKADLKQYAGWLKKQDKRNDMTDEFIKRVERL